MNNGSELRIAVKARDDASAVLNKVRDNVNQDSARMAVSLESMAKRSSRAFDTVLKGVALFGAGVVGAGIKIGFDFNNSLEQAETKLNAFTGNAEQTAKTLAWVKDEAAKTQFSFTDMADAAANLTPVAKTSGRSLEELIRQAEILAALNPAEGLSGAVFSLREALSGDFVSIVDRFNIPRKRLNQLKDEGVPAIDAIRIALEEMGITYDLVEKQGQTTSARWEQMTDKVKILAGEVTKPLFERLSQGLDDFMGRADTYVQSPQFQEAIVRLGDDLVRIADFIFTDVLPALAGLIGWMADNEHVVLAIAAAFTAIRVAMFLQGAIQAFSAVMTAAVATGTASAAAIKGAWAGLQALIATPMVMPAIAVAAAIASVWKIRSEIDELNRAIDGANDSIRNRDITAYLQTYQDIKAKRGPEAARRFMEQQSRFTGGSVEAGQRYTVGEQGRETFVPNTAGRIDPAPGAGDVKNILSGTFIFNTQESVDAFFARIDRTQRLAKVGLA